MKYLVDDEVVTENDFWNTFEGIISDYVDENLDDFIDEENEEVRIGSLTYSPSQVLKECDPVAYRCYSSDMENFFYTDYKHELERSSTCDIDGHTFEIIEDEEEE